MKNHFRPATLAALAIAAAACLVVPSTMAKPVADATPTIDLDALDAAARDLAYQRGPDCGADPVSEAVLRAGLFEFTENPEAVGWQPWVVEPSSIAVAPPPAPGSEAAIAEIQELVELQLARTDAQVLEAQSWDEGGATKAWTELMLQLIVVHAAKDGAKNPPRLARAFTMLETAMFDALLVTYQAKYCFERVPPSAAIPAIQPAVPVRPLPSYPSEHAAVAAAAAAILPIFFPCHDPINDPEHCEEKPGTFDRLARNASESRLVAGVNYRSDIEAGLAIGTAVGQAVAADRAADGSHLRWDGSGRLTGACLWRDIRPPAAAAAGPVEPLWGGVRPYYMSSGAQFRAPPPPACNGEDYLAQYRDLYEASKLLTPRQKQIAKDWAGAAGSVTPPGQWLWLALNYTMDYDLTTIEQSRVLAHEAAALADAAIAVWDSKYTYWFDRPVTAIRDRWDPTWKSFIPTPPFPGYVSGHSGFSGASYVTLSYFFPDDAAELRALASEAAQSRYYGGIHMRADNEQGIAMGEKIGALAVARAAADE